jgi:hypothetical protein
MPVEAVRGNHRAPNDDAGEIATSWGEVLGAWIVLAVFAIITLFGFALDRMVTLVPS